MKAMIAPRRDRRLGRRGSLSKEEVTVDNPELLWRQYQLHIDLYRSYLELLLKFNLFYYAVTGAILSYYFAHQKEPLIKYSLLLPIAMSVAFTVFFVYSAIKSRHMRDEVNSIRDRLGFKVAPEIRVLIFVLWIFAVLLTIIGSCLTLLLLRIIVPH